MWLPILIHAGYLINSSETFDFSLAIFFILYVYVGYNYNYRPVDDNIQKLLYIDNPGKYKEIRNMS